jgi:hypothetical protein
MKYYQPSFNLTLAEYVERLEQQGKVCKICGRPPGKNRLSVDHDHKADRVKIIVVKTKFGQSFYACSQYKGRLYEAFGTNRDMAKTLVRRDMRHDSIRGLLCFLCNGGIQHFEDSKAPLKPAERFDAAAKYFREFEDGFRNRSAS